MIFRLSQKLNTKLKSGTPSEMPLDDYPYADWSSHLFTADGTQYIIMTNMPSPYSCVTYRGYKRQYNLPPSGTS